MTGTERRIYRLSGICAFLGACAFIVPRFFPNPEGTFASASNAILCLLVILSVTLAVSLCLLGMTLRAYRSISVGCRVAGIGPSVLLGALLVTFFAMLGY